MRPLPSLLTAVLFLGSAVALGPQASATPPKPQPSSSPQNPQSSPSVDPSPTAPAPSTPPTAEDLLSVADPDALAAIEKQKKSVSELYAEAEKATELYNTYSMQVQNQQEELDALVADEARQSAAADQAKQAVVDMVVDQYTQGAGLGTIGQVIDSQDSSAFLERLTTSQEYTTIMDQKYKDYGTAAEALSIRSDAVARQVEKLQAVQAKLAAAKEEADNLYTAAKDKLSSMQKAEREQELAALQAQAQVLAPGGDPAAAAQAWANYQPPPKSGRAGIAVAFALKQTGDAYVWAATGPDAWDCSGLTMTAWAQAGVALPHSSAIQSTMGAPVAEADIQPGDLVFYYTPIHHVGMYVGHGMIVNAENPSVGVVIAPLHSMPLTAIRRVG